MKNISTKINSESNVVNCIEYFKGKQTEMAIEDFKEFVREHQSKMSQKQIEYSEFLLFLSNNGEDGWDEDLVIIKESEMIRFKKSDIEDDVMELTYTTTNDFFNTFEDMGVNGEDFEEYFISAKYINELENDMMLVMNIDGNLERFIVQVA